MPSVADERYIGLPDERYSPADERYGEADKRPCVSTKLVVY